MPGARLTRLTIGPRPMVSTGIPLPTNSVPESSMRIARFLITLAAFLSALSTWPQQSQENRDFCDCRGECVRIQPTGICRGNPLWQICSGYMFPDSANLHWDGFVQARFLCCPVGEKMTVAVLLCLWPAGHASGFQVLEDDHFGFAIHQFPTKSILAIF